MTDLVLEGCVASVLASYLKALAVHRLVAEQLDPDARSWWDGDGRFHLVSSAGWEELVAFFVHTYSPTPIVTPWNGGSGFHPGDQRAGIDAIRASVDPRFERYRRALLATDALLRSMGIAEKPEKEQKQALLARARAVLPDDVLPWLDAAYVVSDTPGFSAVLGTGGNDGRLEFANNFMQRLAEMFLAPAKTLKKQVSNADRLDASLFARPHARVNGNASFGQFSPGRVGGTNMGAGFDGDAQVNPWDYVLALEGALLFAGAAVRRLESGGDRAAAFPFHVAMSAVGYGSSARSDDDNARSELWLPLWSQPGSFGEVATFFSEGRLQVGARRAHDGLDAARAVASLGVDRGIDRFQRIGILKRNGLSFLATAQGTLTVRAIPDVALLDEVSTYARRVSWLKEPSPAVSTALRALQQAMFDACRRDRRLTDVLAAVGALQRALGRSPKAMGHVAPLRTLAAEWLAASDDGSAEFVVASAFSSWGLRRDLFPLDARDAWDPHARVRWSSGDPLGSLVDLGSRRLLQDDLGPRSPFVARGRRTTATALRRLLDGSLDLPRLDDLLHGLSFVSPGGAHEHSDEELGVDATFWVLREMTTPTMTRPHPKDVSRMMRLLDSEQCSFATEVVTRRLRAERVRLLAPIHLLPSRHRSAYAAALWMPIPRATLSRHIQRYLNPMDDHEAAPAAGRTD